MVSGLRPVAVVLTIAAMLLLVGCGHGTNSSMPPLTIDPELTAAPPNTKSPTDQVSRSAGPAARAMLQRFLRGLGTADPKVCTLVTAAYAKAAFGKATCHAWVTKARRHLAPADLAALQAVRVPAGTRSGPAIFTVTFTELTWPGTPPTRHGPLRPRFVLRKIEGHWRLAV